MTFLREGPKVRSSGQLSVVRLDKAAGRTLAEGCFSINENATGNEHFVTAESFADIRKATFVCPNEARRHKLSGSVYS